MATIEILAWRDFIEGSGWDSHAKSELKKRLRTGVNASQKEIKRMTRQIHARELVTLHRVREEAVLSVTQIPGVIGAERRVTPENANDEQLFKKWPRRGRQIKAEKSA